MWLCPYWVLCNNDEPWRQSKQTKKKLIVPKRLNGDPKRRTHINLDISSKFELTCTINVTVEMHEENKIGKLNGKLNGWIDSIDPSNSNRYFKSLDRKIIWQSGRHSLFGLHPINLQFGYVTEVRPNSVDRDDWTGHWIKILKFYTWLANCHFRKLSSKYFLEDHELSKSSIEHIKLQNFGLKLCHTTGSYKLSLTQ